MVRYLSHLPKIRIMADYAVLIEVGSDDDAEHEKITNYDEAQTTKPTVPTPKL